MSESLDRNPDTDVDMIEQTLDVAPAEPESAEDQGDAQQPITLEDLAAVEAILFATDSALSPSKIADVAGLASGRRGVREAVDQLNARYEHLGCAFRIEPLAGGYQMLTLPEYNDVLKRLLKVRDESRLSQAAMETLAIVAYKQPILRADVEAIRGVSSGEMIRSLMEKGLVKIVGRAEELGRPMLYGTTRTFLEVFGLKDLSELPNVEALANIPEAPAPKAGTEQAPPETESAGDVPAETGQASDEDQTPTVEAQTETVVDDDH